MSFVAKVVQHVTVSCLNSVTDVIYYVVHRCGT